MKEAGAGHKRHGRARSIDITASELSLASKLREDSISPPLDGPKLTNAASSSAIGTTLRNSDDQSKKSEKNLKKPKEKREKKEKKNGEGSSEESNFTNGGKKERNILKMLRTGKSEPLSISSPSLIREAASSNIQAMDHSPKNSFTLNPFLRDPNEFSEETEILIDGNQNLSSSPSKSSQKEPSESQRESEREGNRTTERKISFTEASKSRSEEIPPSRFERRSELSGSHPDLRSSISKSIHHESVLSMSSSNLNIGASFSLDKEKDLLRSSSDREFVGDEKENEELAAKRNILRVSTSKDRNNSLSSNNAEELGPIFLPIFFSILNLL